MVVWHGADVRPRAPQWVNLVQKSTQVVNSQKTRRSYRHRRKSITDVCLEIFILPDDLSRLLVELVLLLVLFDDRFVGFFKIFGEDDVPVLSHCQHAGLRQDKKKSNQFYLIMKVNKVKTIISLT